MAAYILRRILLMIPTILGIMAISFAVVQFAPGEKHWHGAAPETAVTHIAIQEKLDGSAVEWLEQVTEEEYLADPVAR